MFKKLLNGITEQRLAEKRAELYRNLIRHEARIGGQIFGPVQKGGRREFFCLDERTWVWHEEWVDQRGQHQTKTTRYDVRPDTILKVQDGHYTHVSKDEAKRLYEAARTYQERVERELYSFAA
ncbi:MAG: hypothetical protein JWL85_606 [Candidatus Saccharibacteria bacterium]|nr:hypothetical protein [Candidatus Saccharibacteria bacterium]